MYLALLLILAYLLVSLFSTTVYTFVSLPDYKANAILATSVYEFV